MSVVNFNVLIAPNLNEPSIYRLYLLTVKHQIQGSDKKSKIKNWFNCMFAKYAKVLHPKTRWLILNRE